MIAGQESRQALTAADDRILLVRPDGHEATGQEVEARTTGLALALSQHGLAGQRIGLWSWNSPAAIEAHRATEWIGATRVPVDPGAPPAEAAAVFNAAGVAAVVVDAAHVTDAPAGALVHDDDSPCRPREPWKPARWAPTRSTSSTRGSASYPCPHSKTSHRNRSSSRPRRACPQAPAQPSLQQAAAAKAARRSVP
jgi:acyl-CoA synthetase (AMP-forming)/AMP-acid ligase II